MNAANIVRHFVEHADVINDGRRLTGSSGLQHNGAWLLVPLTGAVLSALIQFEADMEDLESSDDGEPDIDEANIAHPEGSTFTAGRDLTVREFRGADVPRPQSDGPAARPSFGVFRFLEPRQVTAAPAAAAEIGGAT